MINEQRFTIKDTNAPESDNRQEAFEIVKSPELKTVADSLGKFQEAISHDESLTSDAVLQTKAALGQLEVDVGGEKIPLGELSGIPHLKESIEIFQEIKAGDARHSFELTFITPSIALKIIEINNGYHNDIIHLYGLKRISPAVAEVLGTFKGVCDLGGLTEISEEVASKLALANSSRIIMRGVKSFSDASLEKLTAFKGSLGLQGLSALSVEGAKALSKK